VLTLTLPSLGIIKNGQTELKAALTHKGNIWSEQIEADVKRTVAENLNQEPNMILNPHKRSFVDALVRAIETLLGP
jgi:hypothetical protein